jgi:hypothetical protein
MSAIPFQTIDWNQIIKTEHHGETGKAYWQTMQLGNLRIRKVTYTEYYIADHWCQKDILYIALKGILLAN